jgi:lipid-binding SYLF domain-containing protein
MPFFAIRIFTRPVESRPIKELKMKAVLRLFLFAAILCFSAGSVLASSDADTVALFKAAGQSAKYFEKCYGYAVFPNIGKAGFVVGGARGEGHVYAQGKRIGKTTMNQLSVGLQLGGQDYSQIIFFADKRALDEFTSGNFEFDASVSATVITASASVSAGTTGADASASGGQHDAATGGRYYKGMAVFTVAKGGLMYEASVAGQKFSYTPLGK